ncbi:hypothetical protein SAMN02910353_00540 [Ruminococcus sp. YRD2003]|uniref:hypothetical protein n=1 Tax=Ruminococcus sp. YRD2003 TaxID=1452313 RepID=UPI0008B991C6|nr:hypothetical protein SAMN02910353_00540 [Ruminococcus flavefaciens]
MSDQYDDIKHLTRPQYDDFPPMSMSDRAAQFSPFAALVGYDAAVDETARLTDSRAELSEDEIEALNEGLNRLLDMLGEQPEVRVTYFIPDERKSGGRYADKVGTVRIYDSYFNELVFTDDVRIAVADMYAVEILGNNDDKNRGKSF